LGQIDVSYQVQSTYTNAEKKPLVIKLGSSRVLSFLLFFGRESADPASCQNFRARYYESRTSTFCSVAPLSGQPDDPQWWSRYSLRQERSYRH
jgi:hypothetical protein